MSALGAENDVINELQDVITAVVRFANGEAKISYRDRLESGEASLFANSLHGVNIDGETAESVAKDIFATELRFAADLLDAAAAGRTKLVARLRAETGAGKNSSIAMRPLLRFGPGGRVAVDWQVTGDVDNSQGWVLFACALLAAGAEGEQTAVGRCQLESCGRFFKIARGGNGRPQTRYCCDEHRLERHALEATKRQRRARAVKKAAKRSRRKPK